MAKRIKIGFVLPDSKNWTGGLYYILNLVEALSLLLECEKPNITIFTDNEDDYQLFERINYPYMRNRIMNNKMKSAFALRINRLSRIFLNKNIIDKRPTKKSVDVLFPAVDNEFFYKIPNENKLYWIPDFQEYYLPHFFSQAEIEDRKRVQKYLVNTNSKIVFSSQSAQKDFFKIYHDASNRTFVLPFAVSHSLQYKDLDIEQLLKKYSINTPYFFCANQFWAHKNHITLLKAIKRIKEKGKEILVVFSGNKTDYRNPGFYDQLIRYVEEYNIVENTRFLGFIDRQEQLKLMNEAEAIIQPSLFEGWSTVVEDAKSINKSVILSDLSVHREQISQNVTFFSPENDNELAEIIETFTPRVESFDYDKSRLKFAQALYSIIKEYR